MRYQGKYHSLRSMLFILAFLLVSSGSWSQEHPHLLLNKEVVKEMRSGVELYPVWSQMVETYLAEACEIISQPVEVPVPKDPAGGYTHAQHKLNGLALKQLGVSYLISGDEAYAEYAKEIFMQYATLYPKLGQHPVKKSYAPGKLFWQQLNEAVWLVDAIQGYDAIYNYLNSNERKKIEEQLLKPYADFLSVENKHVFNRIHNHGVWAVAAVGMTGITMGEEEMILRALYGINDEGEANREEFTTDHLKNLNSGFLFQTLKLFSPDGYYTEGPYYQRYAMTPFLLFAQSLDNNIPKLDIMNFGDRIFLKAVGVLVDLTDSQGRYFAINDNLKGMSLYSPESMASLCFLYANTGNTSLLDILEEKPLTNIDANSMVVARDLSAGKKTTLNRSSKLIRDGSDGDEGGLALIRDQEDQFCAVVKYASHGLSHGHYDRLNIFYYHGDNEVLTDYGSVRFVNIMAKEGGRYLPENTSYAKQSIAHNTLVINEKSHFMGTYEEAQRTHANLLYASFEDPEAQFVCATETNAYPGVEMVRVTGLIQDEAMHHPLLLDLFQVRSDERNMSYDLPYHFDGDILNIGFDYEPFMEQLQPLGEAHGYQHLWKIAEGNPEGKNTSLTWLDNNRIHTLTFASNEDSELILTRSGANDPAFNMRVEPALIIRERNKSNHLFASVLEVHGNQNETTEMVSNQEPSVLSVNTFEAKPGYMAAAFKTRNSTYMFLGVTEKVHSENNHVLQIEGVEYNWKGNYKLFKLSGNGKIK